VGVPEGPQNVSPGARFVFTNWSNVQPASHTITVGDSPISLTAVFQLQWRLTTNITPSAPVCAGCPAPAMIADPPSTDGFYPAGTTVRVTAQSGLPPFGAPEWGVLWNGGGFGAGTSRVILMSIPVNISATLGPQVTIDSNPAGRQIIVDGAAVTAPFRAIWAPGVMHTIGVGPEPQAVAPGVRHAFTSWSDGGPQSHTVSIGNFPASFVATFRPQYLIDVKSAAPGLGSVVLTPGSEDGFYDTGTVVHLRVNGIGGARFTGWTGDLSGLANPLPLLVHRPISGAAAFVASP
jgi:hypothetical protein